MILFSVFYFLSVVLVHSHGAFIDNLPKCSLKDKECFKELYQKMIHEIGPTGIEELGIPPIDPLELRNVTFSVLDLVDITLIKGVATGVRTCVFNKLTFDLAKQTASQDLTCSLKVEGKYEFKSSSPLLKTLFGDSSAHGKGKAKVSIDKVNIKYDYRLFAQKRADGEIYLVCDNKNIVYNFEVLGGAKFYADSIYVGDQDISKQAVSLMNENWKFLTTSFGQPFIDKSMGFYYYFANKFFSVVPARHFISDDLTPYARS